MKIYSVVKQLVSFGTWCGMRRPSTEHNEDDLNRLTASASVRSTESVNSSQTVIKNNSNNDSNNNSSSKNNSSNYLPNIAIEYQQQCRKRKDRQDSTSSLTQDRKVVRSNSEENVPTAAQSANDTIRRVSSHEDFNKKLPLQQHNENDENVELQLSYKESALDDDEEEEEDDEEEEEELSNQSKVGDDGDLTGSKNKMIDVERNQLLTQVHHHEFDEAEHRRNSERFLKTKQPSGRKSPRRSKKSSSSGMNQDRLINSDRHAEKIIVDDEDEENLPKSKPRYPWESSTEDNPIMCQRFRNDNIGTSFDDAHHSISTFIKHDHDLVMKFNMIADEEEEDAPEKKHYRNFMSVENVKTRDIMQKSHSPLSGVFQTPDERIRQINKRLTSLKKKISNYEESFENNYGYRPSHADKANDKNIKNYIAEIHRMRKEKSQIKADPITAMGYKNKFDNSMPVEKKMGKIKDSLQDIENKLHEKRCEEHRPPMIDDMTPEQLVDEKTSVQRALLYFESIYGRPGTSDERDVARPLYDRYRLLKRLVNRNNSFSGGLIELPTILENEALALSGVVTPSTDFSPPSAHSAIQSPSDSSTSTSFDAGQVVNVTASTSFQENFQLHSMSISQLHRHFDAVREEKKQLRRSIKEFEHNFEEMNGRKMLKSDRVLIDDTYTLYKEKKAKLRLLDALVKKQMSV